MCGSALLLAETLVAGRPDLRGWRRALEKLIWSGTYLFAASSVVFGIDHFLVLSFIASLVPSWIPGGLFWAYLTGTAFIAAGLGIAANWMARRAATLLGTMFLIWFLLLHAPRVVTAPRSHDPHEWSRAFIALAMCGGSWICACHFLPSRRQNRQELPAAPWCPSCNLYNGSGCAASASR